ncbi:MAG: class II aldolase/adducin family protein, partial [Gammaproteobacteria bacterium]|nr:class II aldolase/adducin family protein [Gammaproteobacteria bacterium]
MRGKRRGLARLVSRLRSGGVSLGDDTPGAEPGDRDQALRRSLVSCCRELPRRGLVVGTAGNVSVRRDARHFFVSP